ncbi:MAG: cytidylate kinase family protein [Spirochaetaceae bacterium]|jgi:cytidylate kinase|nr:cytidylate kinase family protein [Spirochaetaceae bacterium]
MVILLKEPLRVALSGKSGCGNTTVSTLLAERLGVSLVNYTFRSLADETGLSLGEIIEKARTDFSFDRTVDTRQVEIAMRGSCVMGSRLAIWMLAAADFRVYLYADGEVRARRIQMREGGDRDTIRSFTSTRDSEDTRRYAELYRIDNTDHSRADMVVDTARYLPPEIVELIVAELVRRGLVCEN